MVLSLAAAAIGHRHAEAIFVALDRCWPGAWCEMGNVMSECQSSLSARKLVEDLVPKLKATERFIGDTLVVKIRYCPDPQEQVRLKGLRTEFEVGLSMIRMNLKSLLTRYSSEISMVMGDKEGQSDAQLALDAHEAVAIENIRRFYQRSQELQAEAGWMAR
jgi:hypothetical protein